MKKLFMYPYLKTCIGLLFLQLTMVQNISAIELNTQSTNNSWAKWMLTQVQSLPSSKAIKQGGLIAHAQQKASQQALYNPQLRASYTNKEDSEYNVVVSQTLDLFDQRAANSQLGLVNYELVMLQNSQQLEKSLAQALLAYIEYSSSKQLLQVSKKQEKLLTRLTLDLKLREEAGDVGQIDAEMAYLSLTQNLQQINLTEIHYRKALSNIQKSLNSAAIPNHPQASIWVNTIATKEIAAKLENALAIQYAQKQLQQSQVQSKIKQLKKKVNPTIGLGAGRDGSEATIIFEISVPLNIRNNFSSQYNAALHKVNQSEFELQEQQRLVKNNIKQSAASYRQIKARVLSWQKLIGRRLKNSQSLLNTQWQSGDISTADYLFSLKQITDTLVANIELTAEMHKAWVEWLLASSQVQKWLETIK
ncbi:MAG: TolC family protein [Pseudomonadota bacterium]